MAARRTTMNIDHELVAQAQAILGTETATSTVHRALEDVIRQFRINQLLDRDFGGMSNDEIELEERRVPGGTTNSSDTREAS